MTQFFPRQTVYGSAAASLTATGDLVKVQPGRPIVVVEWGIVMTTTSTGTNGLATGNLRPTAGSTSGQTVGSTASSTGPAGETQYDDTAGGQMTLAPLAAGKAYLHRINLQAAPVAISGTPTPQGYSGNLGSNSVQGVTVNPGQEFAVNLGTAMGTAGDGTAFITYFELPSVGDANAPGSNNPMANVTIQNS